MSGQSTNDLGTESIGKLLLRLSIPAITAQLINALYNIVDRIYIGHIEGVGVDALTGVGVAFPIIMIISAFSALIGFGGAPRVAIKMGQGKTGEAQKIVGNCFTMLIGLSVILTLFFLFFGRDLLMLFGASGKTIEYAVNYLNIYVAGTVFVQLSMGLNPFISTQGFAKTAMVTVLIGAVLNIVLDPLFIFVFGMGVQGAALATILSQAVSAIWVVKFLCSGRSRIRIKAGNFKLQKAIVFPVLALGVSPFIMNSTESLVNIALNSSLQRYGGDIAVGAMTIIGSIMQICVMPLSGLASSAQPIVGYNFGAKQFDRVKKTFKYLITATMTYSTVMWLIVMLVPQILVVLFTQEAELMNMTVWAARIFMAGILVLGAQFACQQTFVALGQAKVSLILALLRKVILLIPLIYMLPFFFDDKVFGVFFAQPIADVLAATATVLVFSLKFKKILAKGAD